MKTVLIVDDSLFMRAYLGNKLRKHGYIIVAEAKDGKEALLKYQECSPDIVLLDITMPHVNGLTALKNIMTCDPNAKVVMCSAMGQDLFIKEAIKSGAKDFIIKPNFNNLISILRNIEK